MTTQTFHATPGMSPSLPGTVPLDAVRAPPAKSARQSARDHHKGSIEFRLIFLAAFLFFFFTSAVERVLPARWSSGVDDTGQRKSVIGRAKESASIVAGYAFMG